MEQIDPRHLLIDVVKILEKLKIPYLVTGGMAVYVWGRPRFTADIDIVIELQQKNIDSLAKSLAALGKENYIDTAMMREALLNYGEFNFIHGETGVKVDFWILGRYSFDANRLKRRVGKNVLGQKVYFISPEDLILSKLDWYEQTDSARHMEDIESIFAISGKKINLEYLKLWARKTGNLEILNKLIRKLFLK